MRTFIIEILEWIWIIVFFSSMGIVGYDIAISGDDPAWSLTTEDFDHWFANLSESQRARYAPEMEFLEYECDDLILEDSEVLQQYEDQIQLADDFENGSLEDQLAYVKAEKPRFSISLLKALIVFALLLIDLLMEED